MRRTIATCLAWACWATAASVGAAEPSRTSIQPVAAHYHIGDDSDAAAPAAAASRPSASSLANAGYYEGVLTADATQESPASYGSYAAASGGGCDAGCGGYSGCNNCGWNDCYCAAVRVEYLVWWTRGRNSPPLVTTSPAGTPREEAGVLGLPATDILFGGDSMGDDWRSGARITLSYLLHDDCTWLDARFWGLEDGTDSFFRSSPAGSPILARPFFNALLGQPDSLLVAYPGVAVNGNIEVLAKNDLFAGDLWGRRNWYQDCCSKVDILAGYMFTRLDDSLTINSATTSIDPQSAIPIGTRVEVSDSFRTQNEFHGGQIGFLAESRRENFNLEVLGKLAIGNMRQSVDIAGASTFTDPTGGSATSGGGLLALPSNIGDYERNQFCFVPEVNINLAYDVNPCWRLMAGYSFIYWHNVVLAGNQIDTTANLSQVPGPVVGPIRPQFAFNRTDFWAQGLSVGAEYRW